jgi:hypothetical protein
VRYLFRGIIRDTGKVVEGHVEAFDPEEAFDLLGENGIITEALRPDPKPLNLAEDLPGLPQIAEALESAIDSSSSQVSFDDLTDRYRGKKVWVIDRDKIRSRVAQVVDAALEQSHQDAGASATTRERVKHAIWGLFDDNRNIASERNADSIAGMRVPPNGSAARGNGSGNASANAIVSGSGRPASPGVGPALPASDILAQQIVRLAAVVKQAESLMGAMAGAIRNLGRVGGGRRMAPASQSVEAPNEVLVEIFKSNLELRRTIESGETAAPGATVAPESTASMASPN